MKLPRDVSGRDLGRALAKFGYALTRQRGSHMRFTTRRNGEHHLAIPDLRFFAQYVAVEKRKRAMLRRKPRGIAN